MIYTLVLGKYSLNTIPNALFIRKEEQPSTSIHYQEKTTIIKTALKPRKEKDAYHLLARPGSFGTTVFQPQQAQRTHVQETSPTCLW